MDIENKIKPNMSKIYKNGSVWESSRCGKAKIIGKSIKCRYYFLEFEDGTIIEALGRSISLGNFVNLNKRNVSNVGYIGYGQWNTHKNNKPTKEYSVWSAMIKRCYSELMLKKYPSYKNCKVDERWHSFQNFCEDIQELEGYEEWRNNKDKRKWSLDKDIKQQGIENKIYSKDTCMFILFSKNIGERNTRYPTLTGKIYVGIRIEDGYEEEFINQNEFSKKYKLTPEGIRYCLKKENREYRGWSFKTKN